MTDPVIPGAWPDSLVCIKPCMYQALYVPQDLCSLCEIVLACQRKRERKKPTENFHFVQQKISVCQTNAQQNLKD